MRELPKIVAIYKAIDTSMEAEKATVVGSNLTRVEANQALNDQAYFLLCWGQLEIEIDTACREAIRKRASHADWQVRRAWYLYNPGDRRLSGLSFEDRAALVLDRGEGRGSPYAKTLKYYETRNGIAHGRLQTTRLDVTAFVQDCYLIQSALQRAA